MRSSSLFKTFMHAIGSGPSVIANEIISDPQSERNSLLAAFVLDWLLCEGCLLRVRFD